MWDLPRNQPVCFLWFSPKTKQCTTTLQLHLSLAMSSFLVQSNELGALISLLLQLCSIPSLLLCQILSQSEPMHPTPWLSFSKVYPSRASRILSSVLPITNKTNIKGQEWLPCCQVMHLIAWQFCPFLNIFRILLIPCLSNSLIYETNIKQLQIHNRQEWLPFSKCAV